MNNKGKTGRDLDGQKIHTLETIYILFSNPFYP